MLTIYELSSALVTSDGLHFGGDAAGDPFDTPVFDSFEAAHETGLLLQNATNFTLHANLTSPIARCVGRYSMSDSGTAIGDWHFHFFDTDSWISYIAGFGGQEFPNHAFGGRGLYRGASGVISSDVVQWDPFVLRWNLTLDGTMMG